MRSTTRAEITPLQINLIKSSFAAIYFSRDDSAKLFYERFFALAPQLRALFPTDLKAQGKKLMDMLALIITATGHPINLEVLLEDTAKRHVGYGATREHYEIAGDALIWMLRHRLGGDFTPQVEVAWTELYQLIASTMQRIGAN